MEGKTVILSVFIVSSVFAQIQVEAKLCCPTPIARKIYEACRFQGVSRERCLSLSGCIYIDGTKCPYYRNIHDILENSGDAVNEYCKLGCASSVCNATINLQTSDASEIVNGAVEDCTKACSTLCTSGSKTAIETA